MHFRYLTLYVSNGRRRAKRTKIWASGGYLFSVFRVLLTVRCSSCVWGRLVHFRFFTYLDLNIQGYFTLLLFFYLANDQAEHQGPWASCSDSQPPFTLEMGDSRVKGDENVGGHLMYTVFPIFRIFDNLAS